MRAHVWILSDAVEHALQGLLPLEHEPFIESAPDLLGRHRRQEDPR